MSSGARRHRKDRIGSVLAASPRFLAAMLVLPPFFLMESLVYKTATTVLFAILAVCAGKRIRWGYFGILLFSITFFHLLIPMGRVIAEIGPLVITDGALKSGLLRGVTLIGMVFLSVAAVRPELKLPGRLGGLLGRTFFHFESLLEGRGKIDRKDFFGSLDRLLMEKLNPGDAGRSDDEVSALSGASDVQRLSGAAFRKDTVGCNVTDVRGRVRGWPVAAAFTATVWGLWLFSILPTGNG